MITRLLARLWGPSTHDELVTETADRAVFRLTYGGLIIGVLTADTGTWRFVYSDQFKEQIGASGGIRTLTDFPDTDKVYSSEELLPFFLARIPGQSQPEFQARVEARGLDRRNAVHLLREFGERSISNPFRVTPA